MNYTLEQKAVAYVENTLWWRFPDNPDYDHRQWTRVADDTAPIKTRELQDETAEYFIGPTHPRVLSELEGELLDALRFYGDVTRYRGPNQRLDGDDKYTPSGAAYLMDVMRDGGEIARAAIQKAESIP